MMKFRILIADDHQAIRRNLRLLLESRGDLEVAGEAANGREAVEESARLRPDLVITDLDMPELSGLETIRQIRARDPEASIIVLTMYGTDGIAAQLRDAGAAAVIAKSEAPERLIAAVRDVQRRRGWFGGTYVARPRHAVAFYESEAESDAMLLPFIREGNERQERVVRLVAGARGDGGNGNGVDVTLMDSLIYGDNRFEHEAVMERFAGIVRDSASLGFPLTRIIGDPAWMMRNNPNFPAVERRFNDLFADLDDVLICAYDVSKFSSALIMESLRSHPLVLARGELRRNPFYDAS